jgi:modification methylase
MDPETYEPFVDALLAAPVSEFKEWERDTPYFEGCLPIEVMAARGCIAAVRRVSDEALAVTPSKRDAPRIPFGQLVETRLLEPGEVLVSPCGRHEARVPVDGTLVCAEATNSIYKVGAHVQRAPSCNGWTYWHIRREGERVPIDVLRAQLRAATAD